MRGQIHERRQEYAEAIADFKRALEINPGLINAAFAKAACENMIGEYEQAINTYNEAFKIDNHQQQLRGSSFCSTSYFMFSNGSTNGAAKTENSPTFKTRSNTAVTQDLGVIGLNSVKSTENIFKTRGAIEVSGGNITTLTSMIDKESRYVFTSRIEPTTPHSPRTQDEDCFSTTDISQKD